MLFTDDFKIMKKQKTHVLRGKPWVVPLVSQLHQGLSQRTLAGREGTLQNLVGKGSLSQYLGEHGRAPKKMEKI